MVVSATGSGDFLGGLVRGDGLCASPRARSPGPRGQRRPELLEADLHDEPAASTDRQLGDCHPALAPGSYRPAPLSRWAPRGGAAP